MVYVLQYPSFTAFDLVTGMCDRDNAITNNRVYNWFIYGKLPESLSLTPQYSEVYSEANGRNRYIHDVTVEPIPTNVSSVSLAAGATLAITNPLIVSATSSNTAYATATVSNGVLTITGVAAGTATITVKDKANDLMYTITATVA